MLDWEKYDELQPVKMQPGFKLYLRKKCEYSRKRFIYKIAEKNELDFLNQFDFSNFICFDVGANIGYWTIYLGAKLHAKQVHCFEPDPILFSILKKNVLLNKVGSTVFSNDFAIGKDEKNITLSLLPEHSGDNRPYFIEGRDTITVHGLSVDHYVEHCQISKVDFIKMDIQGGESDALDGCMSTLQRDMPVLMVEFSKNTALDGGISLQRKFQTILKLYGEGAALYIIKNNALTQIEINSLDLFEGNVFVSSKKSWLL